jgi:hypothetical protein
LIGWSQRCGAFSRDGSPLLPLRIGGDGSE